MNSLCKNCVALVSILLLTACTARIEAAPLFDDDEIIEVSLTGPISSVFASSEDREERQFVLHAQGVDHQINVRLRGNSRLRVCDFPPLRLDFPPSGTEDTIFAGQDKLKLVTHCRHYDRAEQDMLEEYLAYRIFNILTDASYRVRLLRINYVDTDGRLNEASRKRFGFLLEPVDQFAERIGAMAVTLRGVPKHRHDAEHSALVFVFQYLIGNTDWGFVKADYDEGCCHNGDLYERESRVLFVPYDFDLSGLVNARYAFPDQLLRIKRVTQRLYRGICTEGEGLQAALATVKSHKAEILALPENVSPLLPDRVESARKFLNAFFDKAAKEDKLLRSFERDCI